MPKELPSQTLAHDGDEFTISFRWVLECDNCGHQTDTTSEAERVSCGSCKHKNPRDNIVGKRYEAYLKYGLLNGNETNTDEIVDRLKYFERLFKALEANGWEVDCTTNSGHVAYSTPDADPIEITA